MQGGKLPRALAKAACAKRNAHGCNQPRRRWPNPVRARALMAAAAAEGGEHVHAVRAESAFAVCRQHVNRAVQGDAGERAQRDSHRVLSSGLVSCLYLLIQSESSPLSPQQHDVKRWWRMQVQVGWDQLQPATLHACMCVCMHASMNVHRCAMCNCPAKCNSPGTSVDQPTMANSPPSPSAAKETAPPQPALLPPLACARFLPPRPSLPFWGVAAAC